MVLSRHFYCGRAACPVKRAGAGDVTVENSGAVASTLCCVDLSQKLGIGNDGAEGEHAGY
jgi:hypothetical protein